MKKKKSRPTRTRHPVRMAARKKRTVSRKAKVQPGFSPKPALRAGARRTATPATASPSGEPQTNSPS